MGNTDIFQSVNDAIMVEPVRYLSMVLAGGKLDGDEYCCADIRGGRGNSLKFNIRKGVWKDFATGDGGNDFISLYAAQKGLGQFDAAKEIQENLIRTPLDTPVHKPTPSKPKHIVTMPPKDFKTPNFYRSKYGGDPSKVWTYYNNVGRIMFYIARYDNGKKKDIVPFTWSSEGKWWNKAMPDNRPVYNLHHIAKNPDKPLLIVEGEKAADAAQELVGDRYIVTTWPNGTNSIHKVNWNTIKDRHILIWPDADTAGREAGVKIAELLYSNNKSVKIINTESLPDKWDAADALNDEWDYEKLFSFARQNLIIYEPARAVPDPIVMPTVEEVTDKYEELITTPAEPPAPSQNMLYAKYNLTLASKSGMPVANENNFYKLFTGNYDGWGDSIWYDEFHKKIFVKWPELKEPRPWKDTDEIRVLIQAQNELNFGNLKLTQVKNVIQMHCERHVKNEPLDWIKSLKWDGTKRVVNFFPEYFGSHESKYHHEISKNFWISIAARIAKAGCKVDTMVILEGAQGASKSSALEVLAGKWFVEAGEKFGTKDFYLQLQGKLIAEIAELDTFSKADINTVKKVITSRTDTFRPPYGRSTQDFPRSCIFVGTTNDIEYLRDSTGARRFFPVRTAGINIKKLKQDREQLFAEAYKLYLDGETWWEYDKRAAKRETDRRQQLDPWHDKVINYCSQYDKLTVYDILVGCIKIEADKINRQHQIRITSILKFEGWTKGSRRKVAGEYKTLWNNPESEIQAGFFDE